MWYGIAVAKLEVVLYVFTHREALLHVVELTQHHLRHQRKQKDGTCGVEALLHAVVVLGKLLNFKSDPVFSPQNIYRPTFIATSGELL